MPGTAQDEFSYLDHVSCNTEVHLQILTPTKPIRLRTRLIGVDPKSSIILALGGDKTWLAAKDFIRDGQSVIVRLFNSEVPEANILAFRSTINSIFTAAGRWLVLRYPDELQQVALRQHSRLPINVAAKLLDNENKEQSTQGHLSDISIMGGAYIGNHIKGVVIDQKFSLCLSLADDEENNITITIKNQQLIDATNELYQYGFVLECEQGEADSFVQKIILQHLSQEAKTAE
ncbi:flagellar brake domain-containing protein [Shewanella gelidii]|uniref:Type III secretion system flagellar brake protein YcgR PilZN domain-containing protein n=1 Tax=Shewanella gelidii TaxID=1642821 RepID=A0A917JL99_9GAMM|nr:flagellar brake domain-containing protein [Shewanella gelidii]MCL1096902.1 flagellar brake protein [Shewanella gelidii]GGI71028.1 hypothetical protein GCM10009332_05430 [Shewanella gelidii]